MFTSHAKNEKTTTTNLAAGEEPHVDLNRITSDQALLVVRADAHADLPTSRRYIMSLHLRSFLGRTSHQHIRPLRCSPFFLQPIFRGVGFFHLLSQFQDNHFLFASLADYQMDPNRAVPLMTCSIFNDLDDITLIRADVLNSGIQEEEARNVVEFLLDSYTNEEDYRTVENFNKFPEKFDHDVFVSQQRKKWSKNPHAVNLK
jgi:hypothetical protein